MMMMTWLERWRGGWLERDEPWRLATDRPAPDVCAVQRRQAATKLAVSARLPACVVCVKRSLLATLVPSPRQDFLWTQRGVVARQSC